MKRLTIPLLLVGGLALAWEDGDEKACPATGLYQNLDYGFTVVIPEGLHGCPNSPVGMSDHGVIVPLGGQDEPRSMEAFAAFNAVLFESPKEAARNEIAWIEDRAIAGSVKVERSATTLAGLRASRFVARFQDAASKTERVHEVVCALRSVRRGEDVPSHEYMVALKTTARRYEVDRQVFVRFLGSWKAARAGF